jgi:hypothetical protein
MDPTEATNRDQASLEKGSNGDDGLRETPKEPEKEYITGVKLALVIISISTVYFLNMLDTTVLATVRLPYIAVDTSLQRKILNDHWANRYGRTIGNSIHHG